MLRLRVVQLYFLAMLSVVAVPAQSLQLVTYQLPPYIQQEHGTLGGSMIEKVQALCFSAKLTCEIELMPRLEAEWLVRRGQRDGIFPVEWNQERAATMRFSKPLMAMEYALFRGPLQVKRMEANIGVLIDSSAFYLAKLWQESQLPKSFLHQYYSLDTALQDLNLGRLDYLYTNRGHAEWLLKINHYDKVVYQSTDRYYHYHLALATRSVQPNVAKQLDRAYWKLVRQGKLRHLN